MNNDVRRLVMERADGRCEACRQWAGEALHADHFFGRKHAHESIETVWALCPFDDQQKTLNQPSRIHWLTVFARHAAIHGYTQEQKRALDAIAWLHAKFK